MTVSNAPQIDRKIAEFIDRMNKLGLTPVVKVDDESALVAFSLKEFLTGLKRSLIKSGVPEDKLSIELVPFQNDKYVKIFIKKR
jgi:hypothetical protein